MSISWKRKNPVFFELDGSFNPFFCLITILTLAVVWAVIAAFRDDVVMVEVVAMSLLAVTLNIFVMAAVSQSKAKIIASATSTGELARGFLTREHGASTQDIPIDGS